MGHVIGHVKWTLRIESLSILLLALYLYNALNYSWATFAIFFLAPDLSFLGYLFSNKIGAITYNCAHSLIGAFLILGLGLVFENVLLQMAGLIWVAHIGFDRALGYGLKYTKGFRHTHLGLVGKSKNT